MPKSNLNTHAPAEAELLCRMIEAATGEPRPEGMTAIEAITWMTDTETYGFFTRAARAALLYIAEVKAIPTTGAAVLH